MNAPPTPPTLPTFDPWDAADRLGITVVRVPLRNARGYTDGHATIWVHDGLTQCEERVAATHELVHVTQGHVGRQTPEVEELVRKVTARWLVPWSCLMSFWGAELTLEEIATRLCVTAEVVHDRIQHATPQELASVPKVAAVCASLAA